MLSIIMPVFNHPQELRVMIDSILKNSFQDWELLAVDDGSELDTIEVLKDYAAKDERVRFIPRGEVPKGAQTCRNIGLREAQGEYVCFFDSDDAIAPFCLEQRLTELSAHTELDFMVFRSTVYGREQLTTDDYHNMYGYNLYENDVAAFCARTLPFIVWNNIYRREALLKNGILWDTNLLSLQDAQFNLQTLLAGMKYAYSDKPADYFYRTGNSSSVSKKIYSEAHFNSNLYAVESFYTQVTEKYGRRYAKELYKGALFVNLVVARQHFSMDFSRRIAEVIFRFTPMYGILFYMQIILTWILMKILPYKIARQIPMYPYLKKVRYRERKWLPKMIMAKLFILLSAFTLSACAQKTNGRDNNYELSWSDEFNGKTLNDSIWTKMERVHGVRSYCNFTPDNRMYNLKNGRLRLYARYNNGVLPNDTARFLTGGITSRDKKTFKYGKIEVRARIHGAIGTWPAIWTLPTDRSLWTVKSKKYTEIDLLEYVDRNDFVYQTAHNAYTLADQKNWYKPKQQNLSKIDKEKYNTYSVEILPDVLIFAVNGKETFRYPKVKENADSYFYGIESYIMMHMQVYPPKSWSSGLEPKTFPAYMDIDWIRVYQLKE